MWQKRPQQSHWLIFSSNGTYHLMRVALEWMTWHWTHNSWFPWVPPVHCAWQWGGRCSRHLLKLGADPNKVDVQHETPLFVAWRLRRVNDQPARIGHKPPSAITNNASHSPCSYRQNPKIFLQASKEKGWCCGCQNESPQDEKTHSRDLLAI